MQLLFESRLEIGALTGKMLWVQGQATLRPEPVIRSDTPADGIGISASTVLRDGGRYRMWYCGWPSDWGGQDVCYPCYAESDDGIEWRKPRLGLVKDAPAGNVFGLGYPAPTVFVDPDSPASHRYRGVTFIAPSRERHSCGATEAGYYALHSPDGLHWELDATVPAWPHGDVINAIYHPGQRRGLVALKRNPRFHTIPRRAIWNAELRDSRWSTSWCELVPDEFDDFCAQARGYVSGDYYGMSMLPAVEGTVGFIQQFRHSLPRTATPHWEHGIFGVTDVTLAYQTEARARWVQAPGRMDFLAHQMSAWTKGGIYPSSGVVEVGDEQRLYLTGQGQTHAWYLDEHWQVLERWKNVVRDSGDISRTGYAYWPRWRFFGYRSDPEGTITLHPGQVSGPCRLHLNYEVEPGGSVRAEVVNQPGLALADAVALTGSGFETPAAWTGGTVIPARSEPLTVRLTLERATVWAYEVRPVTG